MTDPLLDAVEDLTAPRNVPADTDTGRTWATEDPLLTQLEDAISSTTGRTGGRSAAHTRMILDADALMHFHRITSTIGDWCRMFRVPVTRNPVTDLRAWYTATLTRNDTTDWYTAQLVGWANMIRQKLAPRITLEYMHACPECDATTYSDDDGNQIPHPVVIDYDKGDPFQSVRWSCRACGHVRVGEFGVRALVYDAETRNTGIE